MDTKKITEKFNKVERLIAVNTEKGKDVSNLLQEKIQLLKLSYAELSNALKIGEFKPIAPIFAKALAFLNSIKTIQMQLNETTSETDKEIEKVHTQMRENGLDWILDNQPEKK